MNIKIAIILVPIKANQVAKKVAIPEVKPAYIGKATPGLAMIS